MMRPNNWSVTSVGLKRAVGAKGRVSGGLKKSVGAVETENEKRGAENRQWRKVRTSRGVGSIPSSSDSSTSGRFC